MTAMTAVGVLALGGVAVADDISNDLDVSVDALAEQMPLTVGGSTGTTKLLLVERNGDGKNGCNLTGSTVLTLNVASSDTSVATVSPSSVTFTSCGDTPTLTVTPVSAGSATVSVSQASNTTAGTFNLAPAAFQVAVSPLATANTAPQVSVLGVTAGAAYDKGLVPSATCSVTDVEDGPSSFPADLSTEQLDADGLGSQTASCSYTDNGTPGLTASASTTYSIVDPSAPSIGYTLDPVAADGSLGWYTGTVTIDWTVTENESPSSLDTNGCDDLTISADQFDTTYTCSAESKGGSDSVTTVPIKRDGTAPSVSYTSASGTFGTNGWYTSPVTATFTATDGFSGPATQTGTTASVTDGAAVVLGSPDFFDNAGNKAAAGNASSPAFKVDTVAPDAPTYVSGPTAGSSFYFGSVPAEPTCTSADATSGLASCVVTGYSTAVGTHAMTATAMDNAGNTSTATRSYTVLAWTTHGFYSPVDMGGGVWNIVKGGATVPLKFEVFAGTTELTNISVVDTFTVKGVACPTGGYVADDIELVATGGTSLRYDTTGGQFIQNWQTPKKAGSCYSVTMTTDDGSSIKANFQLK